MSQHYPAPLDTLSEDESRVLDTVITTHRFPAGTLIFEGGSPGDCCYLVDEGAVRIELREHHADDDQVLDFVEPGNILGEQSLLDRQPRSASAIAHRDVVARRIPSAAIDKMMTTHPRIALTIISALGRSASLKLRSQAARLDELIREARDPVVDAMVERALVAQKAIRDWPEERLDAMLGAMAQAVAAQAEELAAATVAETKIGNTVDKTRKNMIASLGVYQTLMGRPGNGQLAVDEDRGIVQLASPVGVVFGLIPVTNPVATFIFKTLVCLKGRNAVILSPNRLALGVSNRTGAIIQDVLRAFDAPLDLVQWVSARNSRRTTAAFMKHPRIGMILATGGPAMVKAAYSSGNPAIGVGSGNAPTLICCDTDIGAAAAGIVESKSFDNGLICGSEHNLVVVQSMRDATVEALERNGAAVLTPDEVAAFGAAAIDSGKGRLSGRILGRSAAETAAKAGITRPYPIQLIVVPTEGAAPSNPLAYEKMAPILSLFTVADEDEGIEISRALLDIDGAGHTAIIYSQSPDLIQRFGNEMPVSRVLVNSPGAQGVVGLTTGLLPSFTLGCGTFGGTSTTDNVTYTHMLNIKHMAYVQEQPSITETKHADLAS